MKSAPITPTERARIIRQLASAGEWTARRLGIRVRLRRVQTLFGSRIEFSVCIERRWRKGESPTVAAAVEECNRLIRTRNDDTRPALLR